MRERPPFHRRATEAARSVRQRVPVDSTSTLVPYTWRAFARTICVPSASRRHVTKRRPFFSRRTTGRSAARHRTMEARGSRAGQGARAPVWGPRPSRSVHRASTRGTALSDGGSSGLDEPPPSIHPPVHICSRGDGLDSSTGERRDPRDPSYPASLPGHPRWASCGATRIVPSRRWADFCVDRQTCARKSRTKRLDHADEHPHETGEERRLHEPSPKAFAIHPGAARGAGH